MQRSDGERRPILVESSLSDSVFQKDDDQIPVRFELSRTCL